MKRPMTVEQRLAEWEKQPGARVTLAERRFIDAMREARASGVGYGWMSQIIGWEWECASAEMGIPHVPAP